MTDTKKDTLRDANFLCEIGTEEIPAGYLPPAIEGIQALFTREFTEGRIDFREIRAFATPRRLVVMASGVAESQRAEEIELKGPAAKAAYDAEGKPARALEGFLKGNALSLSDVYTRETDKGAYVFAKKKMEARRTVEVIPSIVEAAVNTLPFPKRMRWSDKAVTFPRPVSYFLIMLNDAVVPFEMSGIASSNRTRGHFIQHNRMIEIAKIADYIETLRSNGVILDQAERKELIRAELEKAAAALNASVIRDEELLDTVTFLVEKPHVAACEFDKDFLKIPDIVLITEMKEHQKYFAVRDGSGSLMSNFLVISNNPPTENVKKGNERVIRARFSDGGFFYNEDRKRPLEGFVESLKDVLFHKDLGSIYDKVERVRHIAGILAGMLKLDEAAKKKIDRAALLSKADLNTAMVYEFTSLQGKIGRIYALLDGEDADVAQALDDQYRPRFSGDELPKGPVSVVLSIAEKIDNIFGSFSVGNIPKGSADPYALRRQANAVVEMLLAAGLDLDLDRLLAEAAPRYKEGASLVEKILEFVSARARTIFTEKGLRYDEIDACLSTGYYNYLELYRRAASINEYRKNENFTQMLLSFKRMNNIYTAFRKKEPDCALRFDAALMNEEAEKGLHSFFDSRRGDIDRLIASNRYIELFDLLITGKPAIDRFFDEVMVMVDDIRVRDNRLALLDGILAPFKKLLDFSRIAE